MSIQLSPRDRREGGRRDRGHSRDGYDRERRFRRSPSPGIESSSRSYSSGRKERHRSSNRSRSPHRRRHDSRSRRKHRSREESISPKRKKNSRSHRRERSPARRSRRSGRSKREHRRRRDRGSSTSYSPVRRSRRHKDYSSSSSRSSSSETEYPLRRRRKRRDRKKVRPLVYRKGDQVEFKKSSRRRRSKWVLAEVCEVHCGMYGELTYTVWLFDSRRMVDYVRPDELRFRYHQDMERRRREDEIARYREDLRQLTLKIARKQRGREFSRGRRGETYLGGRGRSQHAARVWQPRAHSVDGNIRMSARPERQPERATSVPPGNQSWPVFLAQFAKAVNNVPCEEIVDDQQFNDLDHEAVNYGREARQDHVEEIEHDHRVRGAYYRSAADMNYTGDDIDNRIEFMKTGLQGTPQPNEKYIDDQLGTYRMGVKHKNKTDGSEINLNFHFPSCRGQQVGDL